MSTWVRAATLGDVAAITELLGILNREEGYAQSASPEAIAALLDGADRKLSMGALLVGEHEITHGVLLFYWGYDTVSASHGYHLADIVVAPPMRRRGLGKQLLRALALQCLAEGGQWVSLTVLKKNTAAKNFYHALGMVEVAVDFFAIGPQGLTRLAN